MMTQTSHTTASAGGANPIAAGSLIAAILLLALGGLVVLQARTGDALDVNRGQELLGLSLVAGSLLCWLAFFVLVGIRIEADRVLAAISADRRARAAGTPPK